MRHRRTTILSVRATTWKLDWHNLYTKQTPQIVETDTDSFTDAGSHTSHRRSTTPTPPCLKVTPYSTQYSRTLLRKSSLFADMATSSPPIPTQKPNAIWLH